MKDIRTTSRILRKGYLRTKSCSAFCPSMSLVVMVAILTVPERSAGGAEESRPTGVATSVSNAQTYFLQPKDVILFLGNSITEGAQPEMDFLVEDFKKQYPDLADGVGKVKLITAGIGGEQAIGGAKRLKGLLDQHKPTVCVVCYGTCEVTFKNEKSFIPAMKEIIKQLKEARLSRRRHPPPRTDALQHMWGFGKPLAKSNSLRSSPHALAP